MLKPLVVAAVWIVGVVALGEVPEDPLDGAPVGAGADLEGFVEVDEGAVHGGSRHPKVHTAPPALRLLLLGA
jgi:hypothetical protein